MPESDFAKHHTPNEDSLSVSEYIKIFIW